MHRKLAIGAAAATAALAAAIPSVAGAATIPVQLSFNHAVLDTPALSAQIVTPSTQPLTATAQVDPTSGAFTIQPSDLSVPTYDFSSPVSGSASLALNGPATGTVNFATGAVTMTADFLATIDVPSIGGSCTVDSGSQTLSTATTEPLPGKAFPAGGPTGVATGTGAFGVGWSTLPAGTGPACSMINSFLDGPGGIWISRNISPTPQLALKAAKPKAVKSGKTATITATLANTGQADTKSVKVCLAAKKPLSPASDCKTVAKPKADSTHKLSFKVKTKKGKTGSYKLTLTATGLKKQTLTLKVTK